MRLRPFTFSSLVITGLLLQAPSEARAFDVVNVGIGAVGAFGGNFLPKPANKNYTLPAGTFEDKAYPGFSGTTSAFGLMLDLRVIELVGLEVDLLWHSAKASGDTTLTFNGASTKIATDLSQSALHIPVLVKGVLPMPLVAPFIFAGPEFVRVSSASATVTPANIYAISATAENFMMFTFGFGAEVKLPIPSVDIRIPITLRGSVNPGVSGNIQDRVVYTATPAGAITSANYDTKWQWQALGTAGLALYF